MHILVQLCFAYHAIEAGTLSALFLLELDKLDKITDSNVLAMIFKPTFIN
jgi:hypothetical protein